MTNSLDPELQKPSDLNLYCFQSYAYPGSAGQEFRIIIRKVLLSSVEDGATIKVFMDYRHDKKSCP